MPCQGCGNNCRCSAGKCGGNCAGNSQCQCAAKTGAKCCQAK
ncbi:metallothionein-2 [Drosophila teissieri]|nr:metallothionein-2 [Drosophila teissieri]